MATVRAPGLDYVRTAAILLVLLQHVAVLHDAAGQAWAAQWVKTGSFGVDLFFALSGFLIGGILLEMGDALRSTRMAVGFWLGRALRTLPNYYVFLAANVALGPWIYRHPPAWSELTPYFVFGQNLLQRPAGFFRESWSLCVEEWFYVLTPLGLWGGLRIGARISSVYLTVTLLLMASSVMGRAASGDPEEWGLDVNMVVIYKFDALGWGLLFAAARRWAPQVWRRWHREALVAGILILVACYLYACRVSFTHSWFARVIFPASVPLGGALLFPWAAEWSGAGSRFDHLAHAIARWSYALYLVNFMVALLLVRHVVLRIRLSGVETLGVSVIFLVVSFGVSAAVYRWIEGPILRWRAALPVCAEVADCRKRSSLGLKR